MDPRRRTRMWTGIVLAGTLFGAAIIIAQRGEVVWDVRHALTTADQRAILELAATAGIGDAQRVSEAIQSPCALLTVASMPTVNGKRVATNIVHVLQRSGPECQFDAERLAERDTETSGNWVVVRGPSNPTRSETWRISD